MASERASSVTPAYALLGLLYLAPGHGYELHERLRSELGAVWTVRQNQVYNILRRLEAEGLVRAAASSSGKIRARRTLRLSPAGRRRFTAWLHKPTGLSIRALRVDFLSRLYFARRLDPDSVPRLVRLQLHATRKGVEQMEARHGARTEPGTLETMSWDLRLRQLRLAVRWLENLAIHDGADSRRRRARPRPTAPLRRNARMSRKKG